MRTTSCSEVWYPPPGSAHSWVGTSLSSTETSDTPPPLNFRWTPGGRRGAALAGRAPRAPSRGMRLALEGRDRGVVEPGGMG